MTMAMISGGFDPLHVGHLDLIETAAGYGSVAAVCMSDQWLMRKKGYCFMPLDERRRIVGALERVGGTYAYPDDDGSVCLALALLRPHYFVNGGDRMKADPREAAVCAELGIEQIFAGDKIRSSSDLVAAVKPPRELVFVDP